MQQPVSVELGWLCFKWPAFLPKRDELIIGLEREVVFQNRCLGNILHSAPEEYQSRGYQEQR